MKNTQNGIQVAQITATITNDWCHFCGNRELATFALIDSWQNAEHAKRDPSLAQKRAHHRVCACCVKAMSSAIREKQNGINT